jgi:hypothetical protein
MTSGGPMSAERVSMRRVREILCLKQECGANDREIARSLSVARSTVALTLERVAAAGLYWPLAATLTDRVLEAMLLPGMAVSRVYGAGWSRIGPAIPEPTGLASVGSSNPRRDRALAVPILAARPGWPAAGSGSRCARLRETRSSPGWRKPRRRRNWSMSRRSKSSHSAPLHAPRVGSAIAAPLDSPQDTEFWLQMLRGHSKSRLHPGNAG